MSSRQYLQANDTKQSAAISAQTSLASRPFAPQSQPESIAEPKQTLEEKLAKIERGGRSGYSLSKMAIDSGDAIPPQSIQMKMGIGDPGARYKLEADRLADRGESRLYVPVSKPTAMETSVQRADLKANTDDLRMKIESTPIQRADLADRGDGFMAKPRVHQELGSETVAAEHDVEHSALGEWGTSKAFFEPAAGPESAHIEIDRPIDMQALGISPKLTLGKPGDRYEQEADRVAAEVVKTIHAPAPTSPLQQYPETTGNNSQQDIAEQSERVQRQTVPLPFALWRKNDSSVPAHRGANCGSEAILAKLDLATLQRNAESHKHVWRQTIRGQGGVGGERLNPEFETTLNRAKQGGQLLDRKFRSKIEGAMGADFSRVKVHTDSTSDQLNRAVQAKAFTTGQDVFFRKGEYEPGTKSGQTLLAHELTHVMQQNSNSLNRQGDRLLQRKIMDVLKSPRKGGGELTREEALQELLDENVDLPTANLLVNYYIKSDKEISIYDLVDAAKEDAQTLDRKEVQELLNEEEIPSEITHTILEFLYNSKTERGLSELVREIRIVSEDLLGTKPIIYDESAIRLDEEAIVKKLSENGISESTIDNVLEEYIGTHKVASIYELLTAAQKQEAFLKEPEENEESSQSIEVSEQRAAEPKPVTKIDTEMLSKDPKFAESLHVAMKAKKNGNIDKTQNIPKRPSVWKNKNIWEQFVLSIRAKKTVDKLLEDPSHLKVLQTMYQQGKIEKDENMQPKKEKEQKKPGKFRRVLLFFGNLLKKMFVDPIKYWTYDLFKKGQGIRKDLSTVKKLIKSAWTYKSARDVVRALKTVVGIVGKIAGSLALLTGLIGLIPGAQPILAFTAVAGSVAMWAALINGSISAIETVIDAAKAAYEKITEGEVSPDRMQSLKVSALGVVQGGIAFATFGLYQYFAGLAPGYANDPASRMEAAFDFDLAKQSVEKGLLATAERETRVLAVSPGGAKVKEKIDQKALEKKLAPLKEKLQKISKESEEDSTKLKTEIDQQHQKSEQVSSINLEKVEDAIVDEYGDRVKDENKVVEKDVEIRPQENEAKELVADVKKRRDAVEEDVLHLLVDDIKK